MDEETKHVEISDESSDDGSTAKTFELKSCLITNDNDDMGDVDLTSISCTACHCQINIKKPGSFNKHPVLQVLICRSCFKWYTSGKIDQDSDGLDEQCRWCSQGGRLVLCDFCHNAFCKDCVEQNLGQQELSAITAEGSEWHCYVCNPAPLQGLVTYCARLHEVLKQCNSVALQSTNQMSNTDIDSNCASSQMSPEGDEECFITGRNVDSLADELYSECNAWVKKLAQLRSSLRNACSKEGNERNNSRRDDMARKTYQHFKTLENCLSKIKKKGRKAKDAEGKRETKRKEKGSKQQLDVDLTGNDLELMDSKVEGKRSVSDEKSRLNCNGNVGCSYPADDVIDTEMQSEDCLPNEQQCRVTENNCVVITDDLSANAKIRLRISLPKLNTADLEAQRLLHLEGLGSCDSSDSESRDVEPRVGGRKREKSEKKQVNAEDDSHELKKDDEEDEEEEAEEVEPASSSEEEYNPKQDLHDLKSEMRHQRREHLKKLKTKAAKHSLKKIKEAVQRRRARAKEAEEEDNKREAKKEDRKVKKEEKNKESLPTKQSADAGGHPQRKSERLTKDKQKQKESEEEEEEEDKDSKETKKAAQMKSKSRAKVSDDATKESEDAGNDEDDLVKGIAVKNVKVQKGKRGSTSNEESCERKEIDKVDTKETKKRIKKKQKSADVTNEDVANNDERNSESEVLIEERKLLENVPKSKSSVSLKLKNRLDAREANNEEAKGKGKSNKGRKGTLVDEQSSEIIEGDKAEENEGERASEEDRIVADDDLIVLDDNIDDNDEEDGDARTQNALAEESSETSNDADGGGGDDDEDEDEDKDDSIKKKGKANAPQSPGVCLLDDDSESEGFGKMKKKQKLADVPGVTLLSSDEDFEIKNSRGKKKKTKKKTDEGSDEDCIVTKRQKKRKHQDSSLESEESDSDSSVKKKKSKKRRRRIKSSSSTENEDENEEGSADDFQSPEGKKRKKIRRIIVDKKLSRQTLDAAKAEEERRQRISDRQKLFNQVTVEDTASPTKCPITTKLVLEADEETKEPIIEVHKKLICKLKPHQVEAIKFMWNCCVESLERLKSDEGSGCILAHCMGLGKTLSVITFVHTLLRYKKLTKMKTCLVLCPLNTILNWDSEFDRWLSDITSLDVYELSTVKDNWGRSEVIKNWQEGGGVLIMGYEMFRTLSQMSRVKNKKQKKIFTEGLLNPGPDLIVCDEGHVLKNDSTGLSKACNQISTRRRVVLTGTPLQNNLIEYHCMVTFVKPNLLGTRKEFLNRFVNPITNGQCSDSTVHDVKTMKRRAHILHETLAGCVQRKDYSALTHYLLPKHEYVILIRLSKVQIELYEKYLQKLGEDICAQAFRGSRIFTDYQNLMKIWTHPWVLKLDEIRQETKKIYKDDADSFIDDSECESEMSFNSKSSKSGGEIGFADDDAWRPKRVTRGAAKKQKEESTKEKTTMANGAKDKQDDNDKEEEVVKGWKTRSRGGSNEEEQVGDKEEEEGYRVSSEWWADYIKPSDQFSLEISGKLMLLAEILKMSESIGDKVLVFSQSLLSLDLIENFLAHWDKMVTVDADKQVAGAQGWDRGVDYIRMDGSTSAQNRRDWTVMFNDEANAKARLFLISTKAGSLGINLVAANRVIIFDASWNPTHDVQSIFRVYRFGQTKPVYVYRFLAQGTMEEKIYERQVMKQSLSQRVIDEHQIERHFTAADLKELYVFKPDRIDDPNQPIRPTPKLPKDRMLAELLTNHKDLIVQYHEHDSLLENKVEEELSEEERKTAWEEYEQEKKGLRPLPMSYQYGNMAAAAAMMQNLYNQPPVNPMSSYVPDAHKIAQAIYAADPSISEADLKQRVQFYLQMQLVNQQRAFLAQQQKQEAEKMQRMQEEWYRQQLMLQQFGYGSSRSDTSGGTKLDPSNLPVTGATASQSAKSSKPKDSGGSSTAAQPSSSSE